METINSNLQQTPENSVLIANCPILDYSEYIVSVTNAKNPSSSESFLSF